MTTSRRFCRFTRGTDPFSLHEIPEHGFCLSTFLVLEPEGKAGRVLVGRLDPKAPWDHLGGLSSVRIEAHSRGWVLPASQLMLGESPDASARRILGEQLPTVHAKLELPLVDSEVYTPRRWPEAVNHWDLRFIYRGKVSRDELPASSPWSDLRWLDLRTARGADFARSHEDVLLRPGFALGGDPRSSP